MSLVRTLKYAAYLAREKKPFTTGYGVYKECAIARVLAAGGFDAVATNSNRRRDADQVRPGRDPPSVPLSGYPRKRLSRCTVSACPRPLSPGCWA